jgi:hypothetical protein
VDLISTEKKVEYALYAKSELKMPMPAIRLTSIHGSYPAVAWSVRPTLICCGSCVIFKNYFRHNPEVLNNATPPDEDTHLLIAFSTSDRTKHMGAQDVKLKKIENPVPT